MPEKRKISIIGGGILGMSIANRLSNDDNEIHIFEAAPDLGGLAKPWQFGDITWDKFYHVILMSDFNTRQLLKELNIENKMNWVETKTGFYTNGKLFSMSNTVEFLKFPPLGIIDKFRLGLTIFIASKIKDWKKLEKQYVADWLIKWSGKRTFNKMWLPLLRAKLGEFYKETSAAFIWATIQRMYAARKRGLKKEMFGYIDGGYKTIIEKFLNYLYSKNVNIHTSFQLNNISDIGNKKQLFFNNKETFDTDIVIFTIPSNIIVKAWPDMPEEEARIHRSIQYLGVSCTSILIKKPISEFYVTNITDNNMPFTGVIEMSALVDKKNFNGNSLIYLPKYVGSDDPVFETPDEQIHKIFSEKILKMYPYIESSDILDIKTAKARNVFALNSLNYSDKIPDFRSKVNGIFYANSALITNGTLNVNETIDIANKFVKEIFNYEK